MRGRLDRFVEDSLTDFAEWFLGADWRGKERDCVNMFAHKFLSANIQPGAAIAELAQVRIESAAPQPTGYSNQCAAKDLVVWDDGWATAWDANWRAVNHPRLVMEWKVKRSGRTPKRFSDHDVRWLSGFTAEYRGTFGYLVRVYQGREGRSVDWAKVRNGSINDTNKRS